MHSLMRKARSAYDLVLIDTPPLVVMPDAFPLLTWADGVIVVSRLGRNRRDVAARLKKTRETAEAPLIGVVANGYGGRGIGGYGYGYGYEDSNARGGGEDGPGPSAAPSGALETANGSRAMGAVVSFGRITRRNR